MAGDSWPLSFLSSLAALLYLLLLMLVASRTVKQRPDWLYLSLFGALALYHTGNSLRYFLYPSPPAWFPVVLLLATMVPGIAGLIRYRGDLREPGAPRTVVLLSLGLLGLLVYGLLAARLARTLETSTAFPATLIEAALVMLPVVLAPLLLQFGRRWMAGQVSEHLERLETLQRKLRSAALALGPQEFRAEADEELTAFFGFPVRLDEQGELVPQPPVPLSLADAGALRALRLPIQQALETSRLVSERLRLEHELAEREKTAALGRMVAFIAHRLKNPLSAINALVQVIPEQQPQAAESCAVIRGEIKRLNDSVNDLLLFTTPSAPSPGSTSARVALEEARALFAADAHRRGVQLEVAADDAMLPMAAAPLHDILVSLVGNALDAAQSSVRVSYSNGVLAVEDDGPGVTDGLSEKIFDPFFTLKAGGTGLGLALARRRAREAGGDIRCISPGQNGTGARFEVTFAR